MKAGGFRLTKLISNYENVMKTIQEIRKAKSLQGKSFKSYTKKAFDTKWDVVKDSFRFESLTFEGGR